MYATDVLSSSWSSEVFFWWKTSAKSQASPSNACLRVTPNFFSIHISHYTKFPIYDQGILLGNSKRPFHKSQIFICDLQYALCFKKTPHGMYTPTRRARQNILTICQIQEEDEESEEEPTQTQRRRGRAPASDDDSDGDEAAGGDDIEGEGEEEDQTVKKLVRYALACEFQRVTIKRTGISEKGQ